MLVSQQISLSAPKLSSRGGGRKEGRKLSFTHNSKKEAPPRLRLGTARVFVAWRRRTDTEGVSLALSHSCRVVVLWRFFLGGARRFFFCLEDEDEEDEGGVLEREEDRARDQKKVIL
mmetsp:Transcript_11397/g.37456  ORF Transcript_11397/g.37456 Transcript_11397/m.37456 type:complete len:117 (-) Transcript_11397:774-1124(-)